MADQVQSQHMIVDFVSILIKATKCVDLIVPAVSHGGIDKAGWTLAQGPGDFGTIAVHGGSILHGRVRHDVGIVR